MFNKSLVFGSGAVLALIAAASCSSSSNSAPCPGGTGAETCPCYQNLTCNTGLACRSNVCINLDPSSNGGHSSVGGSSATGIDLKACNACAQMKCMSQDSACKASTGCDTYVNCILGCGTTDATCLSGCAKDITADNSAPAAAYEACAITSCQSDCVYSGPIGGLGGSSSVGNGGSSTVGNGGTSTVGNGGSNTTSGGSGSAGGPPLVALTSGTNWLYIDGAAAPSTSGPNGPLGIEGVFYAYGDPCSMAQMMWDPSDRCISGTLCTLDTLGTNWGVAIGFDFNNVMDVKHVWNATTAGATGIAWQMTNDFGVPVQVWIQNMDRSFNGVCTAASCSINGPGDGTSVASDTGQFSFATMTKDYWGGTGTVYTFDPTDVSSLQFKLPSSSDGTITYDVCVGALGVVR